MEEPTTPVEPEAEAPEEPPEPEPTPEPDEAEEQEAEEEQAVPPEAEAAQPAAEDLEKIRAKLEKAATRHSGRVSEIMGEDANLLVPCELCEPDIPGFHWPVEYMQPTSEVQVALLDTLKQAGGPDYREAKDAQRCEDCDGYGQVRTGARRPDSKLKTCATCQAKGWVSLGGATVHNLPPVQPTEAAPVAPAEAAPPEDVDPWGSPRLLGDGQENPNFGKMPQYKNANLP